MKIITISLIILLVLGLFIIAYNNKEVNMEENNKEKIYQGPVRPTDDEEHFRKTGETIPLKDKR